MLRLSFFVRYNNYLKMVYYSMPSFEVLVFFFLASGSSSSSIPLSQLSCLLKVLSFSMCFSINPFSALCRFSPASQQFVILS